MNDKMKKELNKALDNFRQNGNLDVKSMSTPSFRSGFIACFELMKPLLDHSVEYGYQYAPNECEECKKISEVLK